MGNGKDRNAGRAGGTLNTLGESDVSWIAYGLSEHQLQEQLLLCRADLLATLSHPGGPPRSGILHEKAQNSIGKTYEFVIFLRGMSS